MPNFYKNNTVVYVTLVFLVCSMGACASLSPLSPQEVVMEITGTRISPQELFEVTQEQFPKDFVKYDKRENQVQIMLKAPKFSHEQRYLPVFISIEGNQLIARGTNKSANTPENREYIKGIIEDALKKIVRAYVVRKLG